MSVPVVVLAGALGVGKTTLLNHLLRTSSGVRIGVVVNDFGAVEVDALLVSAWSDDTVSLANGCLCCALGDDTLDDVLGRLCAPSSGLDVVLVEASGVAEPGALVPRVASAPGAGFGGLVLVVSAVEPAPVAGADLVVLTKTDLVDPGRAEALCRERNPVVPLVHAVRGALDPRVLLDPDVLAAAAARPGRQLVLGEEVGGEAGDRAHPGHASVELVTDEALDGHALLALFDDRPPGLFRAKGFVDLGEDEQYTLQVVGRQVELTAGVPRGVHGSRLVCVGVGMDVAVVRARLQGCIGTGSGHDAERSRRAVASRVAL